MRKAQKFLSRWLSLPLCAQWHRDAVYEKAWRTLFAEGELSSGLSPAIPRDAIGPQPTIAKGIWSEMFEGKQRWQLSRASIWGESQRWHGAFLICIPNSKPKPKCGYKDHSSWQKTRLSSKLPMGFSEIDFKTGTEWLTKSGALLLLLWEIFAEKKPRSRCWMERWKLFFFLSKRIYLSSLALSLGEEAVVHPTIQGGPKPCLFWEGRAGRVFHSSGIQGQGDLGRLSGPVFWIPWTVLNFPLK